MTPLFTALCSLFVVPITPSPVASRAVLTSYMVILFFGISLEWTRYRTGPKTLPYGTPARISLYLIQNLQSK